MLFDGGYTYSISWRTWFRFWYLSFGSGCWL